MGCKQDHYYMAADCPVCGEKDEPWKWKGARMGSTQWGHDYNCCSEKCGKAFLNSPKHKELERERIQFKIDLLQEKLKNI